MSAHTSAVAAHSTERGIGYIHVLLIVQTVVILLLSINRLSTLTAGFVLPNEFLRWVDLNNMLILPLISVSAFFLLKKHLEYDSPAREGRGHRGLGLMFIVGVYLLAAGYGNHEITNYLNARFCPENDTSRLCEIIVFNDDEFSHWVFFAGFVLVNAVIMFTQIRFPYRGVLRGHDRVLLIVNGLFIGAGLFANLAFEAIGIDLYVVALLALLALALLWRRGAQPLLVYYSTAYSFGLVATAVAKVLMG